VRNREAVFFAVLFPVILLVIFSLVFAGGPTEFEVGVQNNDLDADGEPTELSSELVAAVEETDALDVDHLDSDSNLQNVEEIEAETGHLRVLVIPEGFDERARAASARVQMAVVRGTIARFEEGLSTDQRSRISEALAGFEPGGETDAGPVGILLLTAPDDEGAGAVGSILDSIIGTFNDRSIGIEEPTAVLRIEDRGQAGLGATDYFLPAFIVAMILINGLMTVPSAVATFRRDGTLKRLAATPLRKREWILANVIQQSILAVLITGLMLAVAWLAFGVTAVPGPFAIALVVLGAVAFTALGMVIGAVIGNPGSAISLGGAVALPLMFVSGIFWELDLMPANLQTIATFSPVTHFHQSLRHLLILDSTDGVWLTFGLLAGLAVVFLVGSVTLTRWGEFD
jgi:ABC-2 type transport system permease protein